MKRVFTSSNSAEVGFLKSVLEDAGIECFVRNETQAYQTVSQPELWVLRDEDFVTADELCKQWGQTVPSDVPLGSADAGTECAEPEPTVAVDEEPAPVPFPGPWKPFQPWMVLALAILALGFELHWMEPYLGDPTGVLYYPVDTALWYSGQQMMLGEGRKKISRTGNRFWQWRSASEADTSRFAEEVLQDTITFVHRSGLHATNITRLRASLAVLLAENSSWRSYTQQMNLLTADTRVSNFVLAARVIYETNRAISLDSIDNPSDVLGATWFQPKFDMRWHAARTNNAEVSRLAESLDSKAAALQQKDFIVMNATVVLQIIGLVAIGYLFLSRKKLGRLDHAALPWIGWEGLGVFCAAWCLGLLLQNMLNHTRLGAHANYFAFSLWMYAPGIVLLWWRHGREDATPLKNLLASGHDSRPTLILAGFAVFLAAWIAGGAPYAAGLKSHWAEGFYEAVYLEPWRRRWLILLNGLLFAPIGEEILFRGVLFPALRAWMPVTAAALVSSVVFAAAHHYSLPGFLGLVGLGFVYALAVHFMRSLIPSIIAHSLTNLALLAGHSWVFGSES